MTALSFSKNDIDNAVYWNVNVDRMSNQFGYYGNSALYMPEYEIGSELLISELFNRAISKEKEFRKTGCKEQHDVSMASLGKALHTVQDKWAHSGQGAGWLEHALGILNMGPDNPGAHPTEFSNAYNYTLDLLMRFNNAINR